jgi:electron transfer flavoprotein alpha subunit
MAEYQGVTVYTEHRVDKLLPIALEGLGAGRKLADALGQPLAAVLVGQNVSGLAQTAIASGADRVYVIDDPILKEYQPDAYVTVMEKAVKEIKPQILIMGQTDTGRDLAPRLAFRLGTAAIMDCIELDIDNATKRLLATKPVYGGNALAVYGSDADPQIVTIRTKTMTAPAPDASRKGEIINIAAGLDESAIRTRVVNRVVEEAAGIKIEDATRVVAGGRGIGSAEGFKQLEELTKLIKGALGASRPPCDSGWMPDTVQVGLTGKIIAPELYIAIAISGSSQHMSGCSGAKTIVVINKDKEANIFRYARYGVVGDWRKVLPSFTARIRELLS